MIFEVNTKCVLYIHGSVHRDSIRDVLIRSNEMQQYASVYLLQNYSTCFGCLSHPSPEVHQTNCSFWYRSYHVSEQQPSASVAFRPFDYLYNFGL